MKAMDSTKGTATSLRPLGVLLLLAALGGCAKPTATPAPPADSKPPSRPVAPAPPNPEQRKQEELDRLLGSANDLFNRGENDLACEQVNQAAALSPRGRTAAQQLQLQRYQAACESP